MGKHRPISGLVGVAKCEGGRYVLECHSGCVRGGVPECTLRLFRGSAKAEQAAVERDELIGDNRRRRRPEVASGREDGLYCQFLLSLCLLEER